MYGGHGFDSGGVAGYADLSPPVSCGYRAASRRQRFDVWWGCTGLVPVQSQLQGAGNVKDVLRWSVPGSYLTPSGDTGDGLGGRRTVRRARRPRGARYEIPGVGRGLIKRACRLKVPLLLYVCYELSYTVYYMYIFTRASVHGTVAAEAVNF